MEYNSSLGKLILPEYGRNIQMMVNEIVLMENRDERNSAAHQIIEVMGNLFTYLRDIPDFKHKLWDHLALMSNFKLDIDYPYTPLTQEVLKEKPNNIPYNKGSMTYMHYGKIVEMMIQRATQYEEGNEKDMMVSMILNHMKKCYVNWNKEGVSDIKIINDFKDLSHGKIKIPEGFQMAEIRDVAPKSPIRKKISPITNTKRPSSQSNYPIKRR